MNRKVKIWLVIAGVMLVTSVGVYVFVSLASERQTSRLFGNKLSVNTLKTELFYPSKLPENYEVDENSLSQGGGAITYQAKDSGQIIFFSIQQSPPDTSDIDNVLENKVSAQWGYGQAYFGKLGDRQAAVLKTSSTLVLINTPGGLPSSEISRLIDGIKPVDIK